jgi:hypothetical protein
MSKRAIRTCNCATTCGTFPPNDGIAADQAPVSKSLFACCAFWCGVGRRSAITGAFVAYPKATQSANSELAGKHEAIEVAGTGVSQNVHNPRLQVLRRQSAPAHAGAFVMYFPVSEFYPTLLNAAAALGPYPPFVQPAVAQICPSAQTPPDRPGIAEARAGSSARKSASPLSLLWPKRARRRITMFPIPAPYADRPATGLIANTSRSTCCRPQSWRALPA